MSSEKQIDRNKAYHAAKQHQTAILQSMQLTIEVLQSVKIGHTLLGPIKVIHLKHKTTNKVNSETDIDIDIHIHMRS